MEPGMKALMKWIIKNNGMLPWPSHTKLICISQDNLLKIEGINDENVVMDIKYGVDP